MPLAPVIGLEVHARLRTRSKMFCGCAVQYGAPPNARTCPVCLGYPGALPVPNAEAVRLAVRAAVAFGCDVQPTSEFARKNYHYPDLPKGYQITQFDRPLATGGAVEFETALGTRRIPLRRLHLEEDAGKSTHRGDVTELDFNRAGVPLAEIVTEPAIGSPDEAHETMVAIRGTLRELDVCDGDMERGSLRCDANVSIRPSGGEPGTPVEIKNLNSFRNVRRALQHEIARQSGVLDRGGRVERETRLWHEAASRTRSMRSKEIEPDYLYFPEPDIPPLAVPAGMESAERASLPELPAARERRYVRAFGLARQDAHRLTLDRDVAGYFEAVARACGDPGAAARFVVNVPARQLAAVQPEALADLLRLVAAGRVGLTAARREVFPRMYTLGRPAAEILRDEGLETLDDEDAIADIVQQVVDANPDAVRSYRDGKTKLIGYFVGEVVRASGGRVDPRGARRALREHLER